MVLNDARWYRMVPDGAAWCIIARGSTMAQGAYGAERYSKMRDGPEWLQMIQCGAI